MTRTPSTDSRRTTRLYDSEDDAAEHATPLALTASDWQRMRSLQERTTRMPLLILETPLLPKQKLTFSTADAQIISLLVHCMTRQTPLALVGLHPTTGVALNRGVAVEITADNLVPNAYAKALRVTVTGSDTRLAIQGEARVLEGGAFFVADVIVVEDTEDDAYFGIKDDSQTRQQRADARLLAQQVPALVHEWKEWVVRSEATNANGLAERLEPLGALPTNSLTDLAFWVAAAVNPSPALTNVCPEIRPAMLACTTDYDRLVLAVQALQSSIDHMAGRAKLF
jgi:hypothetical protein